MICECNYIEGKSVPFKVTRIGLQGCLYSDFNLCNCCVILYGFCGEILTSLYSR